jgi:SAM-dependent methyltransferase
MGPANVEPRQPRKPEAGIPLLDRSSLDEKAGIEDRHWFYRGRRRVVAAALARLPLDLPCEVLEAGSGTGRNLEWLARYGSVHGVDVNPEAVARLAARGYRDVRQATLGDLPYEDGRFGLLTCLDVLEHVSDDAAALAELRRVTRRDGFLVLTVPAYQALFSPHDVAAGHIRRYTMRKLSTLASAAGWRPVAGTYFNTLLFPAALARRMWMRLRPRQPAPRSDLLATPASLDGPLSVPMALEAALVSRGIRLPLGLSILLALQKR